MPVDQGCTSCAQADQKSTLVDTGSVNDSGTHHSGGGGGSHSGGGGSHHSCGWSLSCHVSNLAHKAYHAVQQHPVIAAVVATAVVVGVVACVAATAGGCAAVLVAGAEGFTAAAEAGSLGGALVGASVGVAAEGGAVIVGSMGIAGAAAAAVAKSTETASAAKAATRSGAKAADTAAEGTASSGAAKAGDRKATAEVKTGPDSRPSFASEGKAQNHFSKHVYGVVRKGDGFKSVKGGPDMPEYQSPDGFNEYVDHARTFMDGPPTTGDLVDETGYLHRIDTVNGLYGLRDPSGVISTFFRKGSDVVPYLQTQLAKYGGKIL